jgi:hypothetical protein
MDRTPHTVGAGRDDARGARGRARAGAPVTVGRVRTTIPAAAVGAYRCLVDPGLDQESLLRCGRVLGNRVECDLVLVAAELGLPAAETISRFWTACTELFESLQQGDVPSSYAVLLRPLVSTRQRDSKQERRDLGGELEDLSCIAGVGAVLEEACGAEPDWAKVVSLGAVYHTTVERDGNDTTIKLVVEADVLWPESLGGAAAPNEIARHIEVRVSHAAWRDRRNRRLVTLEVGAEEIWPVTDTTPAVA